MYAMRQKIIEANIIINSVYTGCGATQQNCIYIYTFTIYIYNEFKSKIPQDFGFTHYIFETGVVVLAK